MKQRNEPSPSPFRRRHAKGISRSRLSSSPPLAPTPEKGGGKERRKGHNSSSSSTFYLFATFLFRDILPLLISQACMLFLPPARPKLLPVKLYSS